MKLENYVQGLVIGVTVGVILIIFQSFWMIPSIIERLDSHDRQYSSLNEDMNSGLSSLREDMNSGFSRIETRFTGIDTRLNTLEASINQDSPI